MTQSFGYGGYNELFLLESIENKQSFLEVCTVGGGQYVIFLLNSFLDCRIFYFHKLTYCCYVWNYKAIFILRKNT